MKKNCGVSYKYIVCMYIGMCAWVFPFIWKWRFASLKLHSCFKESEDTCLFFLLFYKCSKIILIINFFRNSRMYLQNGVKKQNVQNSFICQGNTMSS